MPVSYGRFDAARDDACGVLLQARPGADRVRKGSTSVRHCIPQTVEQPVDTVYATAYESTLPIGPKLLAGH